MQPPPLPNNSEPGRVAPSARLALCIAGIATAWLVLLPWAAKTPPVRNMIERNELRGINPSAKFYSELPSAPEIVRDVRRRREQSAAF